MSHSYVCNTQHIVFSTKERRRHIVEQARPTLWKYLGGIAHNHGMAARAVGGTADHIHLLLDLPATLAVADAVNALKSNSSRWFRAEVNRRFAWQEGYGAFSVSASNIAAVARYVREQEKHHRRRSFDEEYLALLKKHGMAYDPRYVFG